MVAQAAVKIKIMPKSPDTDLKEIEEKAEEIIQKHAGKVFKIEEEPIAFGLKAVIITLSIIETFEQDPLTEQLAKMPHVSSAEIIDFRRVGF